MQPSCQIESWNPPGSGWKSPKIFETTTYSSSAVSEASDAPCFQATNTSQQRVHCQSLPNKFAARQHQEIFVRFGGCTSKDNDVSGMSLWSMQTSQECWMFFLNFLSGFFNMFSWWNNKDWRTKFRARHVPKKLYSELQQGTQHRTCHWSTAWGLQGTPQCHDQRLMLVNSTSNCLVKWSYKP